ncbi:MAG: CPBP family intramembrane metalloprotease [Bacteroidales bacterium]|nr:CPBP family intramembrane metalloprotease [Bacteroidales bacterium]
MKLSARKVRNYNLFANHAWYVPDVGGMFGLLGLFLAGGLVLGGMVVSLFKALEPWGVPEFYSSLLAYPLSFIPAMIFAANKSQRNCLFETGYQLNSSHFGPFKTWEIILLTVLLSFAAMISVDFPNYLNYRFTESIPVLKKICDFFNNRLEQMTGGPLWSSFLLAAIFAPVFEEWLCRGMVLRGFLTKMKPAWAIVTSALFFGLIHVHPQQALNAFLIGLVMGYVYYKTGSLWLTMLIHFVNNAASVLLSQFSSMGPDTQLIDVLGAQNYVLVYVAGVSVLTACLLLFRRIPLLQKRGNVDRVELDVK